MAENKKPVKTNQKSKQDAGEKGDTVPFSSINYILFAAGLIIITAGWFLLRAGHISLSPIMLILGYCVVIPVAIVLNPGKKKENSQ